MCQSVHEALQKVLKVMSTVHEEAMEKMEMWVTLWILEMISNLKKHNRQHCQPESQRNLVTLSRVSKMLNLSHLLF